VDAESGGRGCGVQTGDDFGLEAAAGTNGTYRQGVSVLGFVALAADERGRGCGSCGVQTGDNFWFGSSSRHKRNISRSIHIRLLLRLCLLLLHALSFGFLGFRLILFGKKQWGCF
jgi:hypothetical protein